MVFKLPPEDQAHAGRLFTTAMLQISAAERYIGTLAISFLLIISSALFLFSTRHVDLFTKSPVLVIMSWGYISVFTLLIVLHTVLLLRAHLLAIAMWRLTIFLAVWLSAIAAPIILLDTPDNRLMPLWPQLCFVMPALVNTALKLYSTFKMYPRADWRWYPPLTKAQRHWIEALRMAISAQTLQGVIELPLRTNPHRSSDAWLLLHPDVVGLRYGNVYLAAPAAMRVERAPQLRAQEGYIPVSITLPGLLPESLLITAQDLARFTAWQQAHSAPPQPAAHNHPAAASALLTTLLLPASAQQPGATPANEQA